MKQKRLEVLEKTRVELKQLFVGLDNIIDDIIRSISPWYVTPEVISRPTIVSLWGMTGTGKSSVIKKLIELLGLNEKTIILDCGEESEVSTYCTTISDKIVDIFGKLESTSEIENDLVFVFDEFQHARTLDEEGHEIIKPALRSIWNIIDDGKINYYSSSKYCLEKYKEFVADGQSLKEELGGVDIPIKEGVIDNKYMNNFSKTTLGIFYKEDCKDNCDEEKKQVNLFEIVTWYTLKDIYRKLNIYKPDFGDEIYLKLKSTKSLFEFVDILTSIERIIFSYKQLDCSKSLVFIIGNLDEAFKVQSELDHDGDADTFYEISNNVTVVDIKNSLRERFRAEQISRLGNNLIKYPTLNKSSFQEIIRREVSSVLEKFKNSSNIEFSINSQVYELLYSEGVCPTQGVRPVFTTINTILTPIVSEIVIKCDSGICEIFTEETNFNIPEIIIKAKVKKLDESEIILEFPTKLQLGNLRDPRNRKTRYASSVHEAGHAIITAGMTGKLPIKIVSVDSSAGGCCYTFNKDRHSEIPCKRDYTNDIMISLGGYIAEQIIFEDSEQCLLGSGSDIDNAWELIKEGVFDLGYFEPFKFSDHSTKNSSDGNPGGLDIKTYKIFTGEGYTAVYDIIEQMLNNFKDTVTNILTKEKKLLAKMALYLGESGSMNRAEFEKYIKDYSTDDFKKLMKTSAEELDYEWYKNRLLSILEEE